MEKERTILILALFFGYVPSLFAALKGFREAALLSSLLIYLDGITSYRTIGEFALISLSLAGVAGWHAVDVTLDWHWRGNHSETACQAFRKEPDGFRMDLRLNGFQYVSHTDLWRCSPF